MPPLEQSCRATLRRSAIRHEADVRRLHAVLMAEREEHGSLRSMVDAEAYPDRLLWRAPALVDALMAELQASQAGEDDMGDRRRSAAEQCTATAEALLPRLSRWFPRWRADHALRDAAARALRAARRSSPCYGVVLLRTWCDGWNTDHRHGRGLTPCRFCGRKDGDKVQHLIRCPLLMRHAAEASGALLPVSFGDSLCLVDSPAAPGSFRRPAHRPTAALLRTAVASKVYHRMCGRGGARDARARRFREQQVAAAAKSAARKFRGL